MRSLKAKILMKEATTIFVLLLILLYIQQIYSTEINVISDSQFLTEEDTLVSPDKTFELGFFRPSDTEKTIYLGIWYKKILVKTVVWVANRDRPLIGAASGVLKIVNPGNLVIMNNVTNHLMWSSNTTSSGNVIAKLLDTGNLVLMDQQKEMIWQSFDYPTDTLLPGMRFGRNFLTRKEWHLSSWKNSQDPALGEFTYSIDTRSYPQNVLRQGDVVKYRAGPWNGIRFSGASEFKRNTIFTYNMVINEKEVVYSYNLVNSSVLSRLTLNSSGQIERTVWVEDGKKWQSILSLPKETCDTYNICGAYGSCTLVSFQTCLCLDDSKFVPRNPKGWETADWSGGCVRKTPLDCENGSDGFIRYFDVKLPDTQTSWFNMSMTLKECEAICRKNCTCMAYANTDIRGEGSGCLLWFNDLKDIRMYSDGKGGQDIFVRMASSDLVDQSVSTNKGGTNIKIILLVVILPVLLIGLSSTWFFCAWRKRRHAKATGEGESLQVHESNKEAMELPLFSFSAVAKATARFSPDNKLGEGGFGPVYKGILEGGEIAVKRLSNTSSQGLDEFKNEVICISKLQHRNLVKLLGCSIEGDEKLLIYEYMPNKSLDSFIFDKIRSTLLDWTKRFNIIAGIARGLLYLHQDSRLRIIHRDLKASNILLDLDMNPKISDFGLARSFGGNETEANTERVVGTYGYMSPEYALDGLFSTKSDVFSFGVLVLEIISGKRNRGFIHSDHTNNLIGHAWTMHNEGRSLELVDTNLEEAINPSEVLRSIEVGLLCVQQSPDDRPNMSSVVRMLGNELGVLQKPKQPAFFTERNILGADSSSSTNATSSTNYLTVTESRQDPAPGELTYSIDTHGYPQDMLKQGSVIKFRAGPWNGVRFNGASDLSKNLIFTYDMDMKPKISDFGIARSFGGNETQANTERVVGTYGYMSPEYALDGIFSTKSDVFSFGVLVLEIVSGKRNRGFVHPEHDNNLIGHAWRLHNEGRSMELMDTTLSEPSNPSEVVRSIDVGLLCVQQSPEDRPIMLSVVLMLCNEGSLQKPKQPAFFLQRNSLGTDFSSSTFPTSSTNDLTVTEITAR